MLPTYLRERWILSEHPLPWTIYIGCTQGHSTGIVEPTESAHKLTPVEMYSFGWIFHVTDQRFEKSIYSKGLVKYKRDSLHFMYENDGQVDYIRKGARTTPPRHYDSTRVLKIPLLIHREDLH